MRRQCVELQCLLSYLTTQQLEFYEFLLMNLETENPVLSYVRASYHRSPIFRMKHILVLAAALTLGSVSVANANSVSDTVKVPSMQCGMCESKIEKALKNASYITTATADSKHDVVYVTYDKSKAKLSEIEKLISLAGYDTENVKADQAAQAALHGCCKPGAHDGEDEHSNEAKPQKKVKKATK